MVAHEHVGLQVVADLQGHAHENQHRGAAKGDVYAGGYGDDDGQDGRKVHQNPGDYAARAEIMWIGTVAHNNTVGVGRNQDWSAHNIANELSALYDVPHGATLSIITPYWMKYVYKAHLWRFERFAEVVFGIPHGDDPEVTALAGIDACTAFFRELGMPTCFSENRVEIPTDRLEEMSRTASKAFGSDTIGSFMPLKYEDILAIFKAAAK